MGSPSTSVEPRQARRRRFSDKPPLHEVGSHERPLSPKRPRTEAALPGQDEGGFVWRKKLEQQRKRGEQVDEASEALRRAELATELESAKRRRAERDADRAAWEAEQARISREREQEENADWHRQEAGFDGTQHFLRQAIRLRQDRARGSDVLAKNLRLDLVDVGVDDLDPVERLGRMGRGEIETLKEGIERELDYVMDFDAKGDDGVFNRVVRVEWWKCVQVCMEGRLGGAELHSSVRDEVEELLKGKSLERLEDMQKEIKANLEKGEDEFAEVDFWTVTLGNISVAIAEIRLKEMNKRLVAEKKRRMAKMPKVEKKQREKERAMTEIEMMEREAAKGMGEDEEQFADEVEVKKKRAPVEGYAWNDKYRPRKPRYYNRVHTGYDWTKYNRTHYDRDNPPPKTVQGYRFNIFYPDLIDSSKTPTYTITKTENPEVCIITFKAGPPYEDLAFKIVNRPWEHSHKKGYRCSFDRGILQMWFNFQRYRYRR